MDSLQRERFQAITGHDRLPEIEQGIAMAQALGLQSIKLNAVLLRGLNDDELPQWMDFLRDAAQRALHRTDAHRRQRSLFPAPPPARRRGDRAAAGGRLEPAPRAADAGPAREFGHPDHRGSIGIIAPYSRDFCAGCNRLRVTARATCGCACSAISAWRCARCCRSDADHDALLARITTQLGLKAAGHGLHQGQTGLTPHLASIGG
jgi:cyclic pyranopterin phosphate synthase